ncbi:hypothetical protein Ciccas_000346 [Cichlidogyrus casuarinus]|uniref:3-dehydrosphinganine reductase n=1 Tax=Cichlidogyrus casuarinus TaxID=1844966 RepID=A0ABD2QN92_9PLAT
MYLAGVVFRYFRSKKSETYLPKKHVMITGGSSGIGLQLAILAHKFGANVTIVARNQKRLEEARRKIMESTSDHAGWVSILSVDISASYSNLSEAINSYISTKKPIDVLINCAGFAVAREFINTDPEAIEDMMRTNCISGMYITRILLPSMLESSDPSEKRIAFVSSMAGQVPIYGFAAYSASKFALKGFTDALRMEMSSLGPKVTIAFPPDTDTPGLSIENEGKPNLTKIISGSTGLASPHSVAYSIINDISDGRYISSYGFVGTVISWATAGIANSFTCSHPIFGPLGPIIECFVATPIRILSMAFSLRCKVLVKRELLKNPPSHFAFVSRR